MANTCSICKHPQATAIDAALVAGTALRNIAEQYGTSLGALHRHKAHVPATIAKDG